MRILVCLFLAVVSCATPGADDAPPSGGKADDLDDSGLVASLADVLSAPDVFVMPPAGEDTGANEFTADVEVVTVTDERLAPIVSPRLDAAANELVRDEDGNPGQAGMVGLFDQPDIHTHLETGFQRTSIRDALLATVAPDKRDDVDDFLSAPDFAATYVHFLAYDLGSEVVGREIFVIYPFGTSEAIVVTIQFVQS